MVMAYYGLRNGGSGGRVVRTAADAERLLRGGCGVTSVTLRDANDQIVGRRWQMDGIWVWAYEPDAFPSSER